ncbi:hypothetical protein F5Y16DRAFT_396872 [Xylariaceae sp. FL0255]|nr:hypothetical protein F5Y16DRAFT_396872 [Xylariaceae sp. FL0255]
MPNQVIDDVKTSLKGIKGAGDAIRGEVLAATDQVLDTKHDTHAQATQQSTSEFKNRAVAEEGKRDMQAVDDMVARREQEHEAKKGLAESLEPQTEKSYECL